LIFSGNTRYTGAERDGWAHLGACGNETGTFTMAKKRFYIGDILNLLFYDVNGEHELFPDEDRSEGIEDLIAFMLGLNTDPQTSPDLRLRIKGMSEADEYFEDDYRYSCAMQMCIESLCCQFACFTERKFRNELRSLKKRSNKSCLGEELETSWLSEQARLYVVERRKTDAGHCGKKRGRTDDSGFVDYEDDITMLEVESIGYLHVPPGQERFELVQSFELFNDRPMNTN